MPRKYKHVEYNDYGINTNNDDDDDVNNYNNNCSR